MHQVSFADDFSLRIMFYGEHKRVPQNLQPVAGNEHMLSTSMAGLAWQQWRKD